MVKSLPKVLYYGAKIIATSVLKSIQEEIQFSRELAKIRYQNREVEVERDKQKMCLEEALRILNTTTLEPKQVEERYKYLSSANKGFFYLQSKVFRAKEVIDSELSRVKDKTIKFTENKKTHKSLESNGKYLFFTYVLMTEKQ